MSLKIPVVTRFFPLFIGLFILNCLPVTAQQKMSSKDVLVHDLDAFNEAVKMVTPGQSIVLANGTWTDVEFKMRARGTASNLITLKAEEKGKVFIEGESNLKIGGEYIHVEGLVFRNGHTATSSVISFQTDKKNPCNNCRVTECVIDDYNPSERFDTDYWVEIFGKNNRFDHNYMVGKRNRGVTLAVRLKNERDRENNHRIDHNYFGYHPILGSNGGETLRIGTSHYSLTNSNTLVEDNYFEKCNGEHEIISNKSCQNTFRNNSFFECQGTLTMRHGNETLVENNYFFGNKKANTGGIRIINETQTVRNNYCEGLTGYRFRGALVIMNGVPNSPINRYFQVKDSDASNNLILNCDYIQLCAGSDEERSATPVNTTFTDNIIYNTEKDDVFTIYDDVSGIDFENNILSKNIIPPTNIDGTKLNGFNASQVEFSKSDGIYKALGHPNIGPTGNKERPGPDNTGVQWYPKKNYEIVFDAGKTIHVQAGENTIYDAVKMANSGDVLVLASGDYHQTRTIKIPTTISIRAATSEKPTITFERSPLFSIENGGSLKMTNIEVSGADCDDYSGNSVFRTSRYSMINNYKLLLTACDFTDLDVNHSFNVLKVYKNTFADSILLADCNFKNISGHILNMDKEIDDIGIYNAENVEISNCNFTDIGGSVVHLHRGGKDESTFGPILSFSDSKLVNVGHDKRNKNQAAIKLYGVQYAKFENLDIKDAKRIDLHLVVGEPVIILDNIKLDHSEKIISNSDAYQSTNIEYINTID